MTARYIVLHHTGIPEPHYDLMFDTGDAGRLITWRSPIWPIDRPTTLTRLPDHRREYLTFEGEISDERGRVDRVSEGLCHIAIEANHCVIGWQRMQPLVIVEEADGRWRASGPQKDDRRR